jgi:hypothetical protein
MCVSQISSEGLTDSVHVKNSVHNQAAEANQSQPLVPKALLYDKAIYCLRELSSPCGTEALLYDKDTYYLSCL